MTTKYSKVDLQYRKKKSEEEMQHQVITFAIMILLTCIAFAAVEFKDKISPMFTVPFILILGIVQVIFQLYYFMHMKHSGHGIVSIFMYTGITIAFITILTFLTIIWG